MTLSDATKQLIAAQLVRVEEEAARPPRCPVVRDIKGEPTRCALPVGHEAEGEDCF